MEVGKDARKTLFFGRVEKVNRSTVEGSHSASEEREQESSHGYFEGAWGTPSESESRHLLELLRLVSQRCNLNSLEIGQSVSGTTRERYPAVC